MTKDTHKLLGTSPSLAMVEKLIGEYFCGERITLRSTVPGEWAVSNSVRELPRYRVIEKRGRYRFEMSI